MDVPQAFRYNHIVIACYPIQQWNLCQDEARRDLWVVSIVMVRGIQAFFMKDIRYRNIVTSVGRIRTGCCRAAKIIAAVQSKRLMAKEHMRLNQYSEKLIPSGQTYKQ